MPTKTSAGILIYRTQPTLEFMLGHPGGPYCAKKEFGCWSIPKGEVNEGEDLKDTAIREFEEETGVKPTGTFIPLNPITQKGGKVVYAWGLQGNLDPTKLTSNQFEMEWPPRSGQLQSFPEVDRFAYFTLEEAKQHINPAQIPILEELARKIS
jgi:predicted NUDIX family NTP pyrophosphohydrolase